MLAVVWIGEKPQSEAELLSVALALLGDAPDLSPREASIIASIRPSVDEFLIGEMRAAIIRGGDPLGDAFCSLRHPGHRRAQGQTFTPTGIVSSMISRALVEEKAGDAFSQIIDGGAGTGRFTRAAGAAFPESSLVAIEFDPVCAVLLRANLSVAGLAHRTCVLVADYREVDLPRLSGRRLFIGNPPYVRHHQIGDFWKDWYVTAMRSLGVEKVSKLAGLHLHFFARVGQLARAGDVGIFVTSAEWTDTNYGSALRNALCGQLGGVSVHIIDAKAEPFPGVMTTAAITVFTPEKKSTEIHFRAISVVGDLGILDGGTPVNVTDLRNAKRWEVPEPPAIGGAIEVLIPREDDAVGRFFRVSRGQVTGANHVWIASEQADKIPARFLLPCVTSAKELFAAHEAGGHLDAVDQLERVIDLPRDLTTLSQREKKGVADFLKWAVKMGGDSGYVARHRSPWWAVRLLPAAPIICTYMARRPPVFIRNRTGVRLLNIAHGLFPHISMTDDDLDNACEALNHAASLRGGRVYAGGLTKFEPSAIERLTLDWQPVALTEAAE